MGNYDFGLGKVIGVEGSVNRLGGSSVGNIGVGDSRVNERGDIMKGFGGGKRRVGIDERFVDGKGVEVGFGSNEVNGS